MMAFVVNGDALKATDVDAAFNGIEEVDAVVSTIGGTVSSPSFFPNRPSNPLSTLDDSLLVKSLLTLVYSEDSIRLQFFIQIPH